MLEGLLFFFLGIAGSAAPAHFGMRVLAHRQHLDRKLPFAAGCDQGGLIYSWWLMRFGQRKLNDGPLRQFGNIAGVMGWITLLGVIGSAICIAAKTGG